MAAPRTVSHSIDRFVNSVRVRVDRDNLLYYRTGDMTLRQARDAAAVLSADPRHCLVELVSAKRNRWFVQYRPTNRDDQRAMYLRAVAVRMERAAAGLADWRVERDTTSPGFYFVTTPGGQYRTNIRYCTCTDYETFGRRAGIPCKHALGIACLEAARFIGATA